MSTQITRIILLLVFALSLSTEGQGQMFNSAIGVRLGYEKTAELSAKIGLSDKNYLEGTIGSVTPQPDFTIGAGIAYHRHVQIGERDRLAFYYGLGTKAVIGDETGWGVHAALGLVYVYKRINIGIDVLPTYFFNDVLEFRPLAGIHLRWINK